MHYIHTHIYVPRARTEPSPAKTKMKVATNSAKVALMESGWVASSALPKAYLRGGMVQAIISTLFLNYDYVLEPFPRNGNI